MYSYRKWQPSDLPWLDQAAAISAWESLSLEERMAVQPATLAEGAQKQLREILGTNWGTAIVVQAQGRPAGFVLVAIGPDTTTEEMNGHLIAIWVAPEHRRQGLARTMQAQAEELLTRAGIRKVKVWTGLHNQPAVNLARKAGYEPEGLIGMKQL